MKRRCNPLGPTSQKLDKKLAPEKKSAKQGIQPSTNRSLHPLGSVKIIKNNLDLKTVPISFSSGLANIAELLQLMLYICFSISSGAGLDVFQIPCLHKALNVGGNGRKYLITEYPKWTTNK